MALTFDSSRILHQLAILRERSIYTARDTFVEQLFTESPVNFDAFVFQSWTTEALDEVVIRAQQMKHGKV